VVLSLTAAAAAQEVATTNRLPFDDLKSQYDEATKAWEARYSGLRTNPSEQLIERYDAWPAWSYIPRIVKLGTAEPEAPYSFEALESFVDMSRAVGAIDNEYYPYDQPVMTALRTRHIANPRILDIFKDCARYVTPGREALLRDCVEKGSTRDVRGLACYYLAEYLRHKGELAAALSKAEEGPADAFQTHVRGRWSPDFMTFVRTIDPGRALAEAKAVDQRVIDEFGDVFSLDELPFTLGKPTLGFLVRFRLAQTSAVSVGQPAPEIACEDLEGKERKLSDYKGKIVVLHFWATWCPPCVEKIPQLAKLAAQHEKEPFCVLGVNYDRDREAASKFVKQKNITWASWWAIAMGESMGGWFVDGRSAPDVLVLDHAGVLRYHGVEGAALDKAVDALLQERGGDKSEGK